MHISAFVCLPPSIVTESQMDCRILLVRTDPKGSWSPTLEYEWPIEGLNPCY